MIRAAQSGGPVALGARHFAQSGVLISGESAVNGSACIDARGTVETPWRVVPVGHFAAAPDKPGDESIALFQHGRDGSDISAIRDLRSSAGSSDQLYASNAPNFQQGTGRRSRADRSPHARLISLRATAFKAQAAGELSNGHV